LSPDPNRNRAEEVSAVPWKEICHMEQRLRFITMINDSDDSLSELCRRFGISRKTGYKWIERYEQLGPAGLLDRAPVASTHPHATPSEVLDALFLLRKEHPSWGPKKLRVLLLEQGLERVPSASRIAERLKKHGLIRPRRRRVRIPACAMPLVAGEQPNDLWCVDFKGHFPLGDKTRCHPLTISDHASRYLFKCEALTQPTLEQVRPHFERAFREFGMPERMRSDNGPPFATNTFGGLSALSVWWIKLGIVPERIEPGQPQQNGRHERMHRTLKDETAAPPADAQPDQQRRFDCFRHIYNDQRPHEALSQKTPASRYSISRKPMPTSPRSPEYPETMKVRRLDASGRLHFRAADKIMLTRLLAGEPVGFEPIDDETWQIFYGPLPIAELRLRGKSAQLHRL
jgi:putative transposase